MKKILVLIALIGLVFTGALTAGVTSGKGKLSGSVVDAETGKPIEGVTVKLFFPGQNAFHRPFPKTDAEGKWKIHYVRKGRWDLDFSIQGYEVKKISFFVETQVGKAKHSIDISLKKMEGPTVGQEVVKEIENAKQLMVDKKFDEAIKAYEEILAKNKEESGIDIVYLYIGNCYSMKNEYQKAIDFFKKSIAKFPKNKEIILSIGNAYNNLQNPDEAIKWFGKLKIEEIGNVDTLYNIGVISYNKGDLENAAKFFGKAVEVDQSFAIGYYQLGMALLGVEGKSKEAVVALKKYIELEPDSQNAATAKEVLKAYDVK